MRNGKAEDGETMGKRAKEKKEDLELKSTFGNPENKRRKRTLNGKRRCAYGYVFEEGER